MKRGRERDSDMNFSKYKDTNIIKNCEVFISIKKKKREENCIVMEMTTNLLLWTLTGPSVSVPYLPDIYTRAVILISCIPCEFPCCKEILILPVSSFRKTV